MKIYNLLKLFPFFWILGLHLPLLYFYFIRNISLLLKNDFFLRVGLVFLLLQLLSITLSLFHNYYDSIRVIASLHNTFVYSFVLLGYITALKFKMMKIYTHKSSHTILLFIILLSFIALSYYYLTDKELYYQSIISNVDYLRKGYTFDSVYPRLLLFSSYPNGLAILIFLTYSIYLYSSNNLTKISNHLLSLLIIILAIFTGSRLISLLTLILYLLIFLKRKWILYTMTSILLISIIISIYFNFWESLINARENSNNMRLLIYSTSINIWLDTNILFGVGLKPYVDPIEHYPLGSHSTIIGYFFKNGLAGGTIYLFFCFTILFTGLKVILLTYINKLYNQRLLILTFSSISILIIYILEDLDAIEINALITGFILGLYKQEYTSHFKRNTNENKSIPQLK